MGYTPPYLEVRRLSASLTGVYGNGFTTGDDLKIYPNKIDATPTISLNGASSVYIVLPDTAKFHIEDSEYVLDISRNGSDVEFDTLSGNKNIYLKPHGTGKLKFGTYTAGVKADSIGYIEVLDSGGTSRRLMVQSA